MFSCSYSLKLTIQYSFHPSKEANFPDPTEVIKNIYVQVCAGNTAQEIRIVKGERTSKKNFELFASNLCI